MKTNKFVQLVSLLLCILMLTVGFAACDNSEGTEATTTTPDAPTPAPTIATTLTQMEIENGMSYVIRLSDGRFIVIDGGIDHWGDRVRLYAHLMDNHVGEGDPVIACWLITHLDGDHFDNAYVFWQNYRDDFEIQSFAYTIPDEADFAPQPGDSPSILTYKDQALAVLQTNFAKWQKSKEWFPDAEYWDMKAGDVKTFADVRMKVLMTANERIPASVYTNNQRSAVVKMTFTQDTADASDDTTFMVFGDNSGNDRNQWIIDTYGAEELKCDVMQVIHHGLAGGYKPIYQAIDPSICLWPTPKTRFEGKWDSDGDGVIDSYQYCTDPDYNAWLRNDRIKKRQHYHHTTTTTIDMSNLSVTVTSMRGES